MIHLSSWDWITLACFLILTLIIAFVFSKKNKNLKSYYQAEGKLPWFIAGTAMVATTFAADTPLAVTEIIAKDGISGNWAWWYMSLGAVSTVFIFAPLWKRSNVLTDLEFLNLRYGGLGASILRGAKAFYLGGLMNILILAWVNLAMYKILQSFLSTEVATWSLVGLFLFGYIYTSLLGLRGISYIDVFQFFFAMAGCIFLAYFSLQLPEVGGLNGLASKISPEKLSFFPNVSEFPSFFILLTLLWWTSWYPGSEPGGGGYIAQRIIAAKDEESATKATLWFLFAHYFIRPWPWIIIALCSLILFPNLSEDDKGKGFIYMIEPALAGGGKGIIISTFIAAYLSTIATHLNWGASYIVTDLTKPFLIKNRNDEFYLAISYLIQAITGIIALYICFFWMNRVSSAWFFLIEASSGIGFALVFRWFWWRISAWSELAGFILAPLIFLIVKFAFDLEFPYSAAATAIGTIGSVLLITIFYPNLEKENLLLFYNIAKPFGIGWRSWAREHKLPIYYWNWQPVILGSVSSLTMIFVGLDGLGKLFFESPDKIILPAIVFFIAGWILFYSLKNLFADKK
ncbi:sodium:solute symporter family protein [Leptospira sp. GIMC2001]|uniref:sodium:solute symporter family protein n=1 Tax=Leptospira sp. GIMC2001 TaxID=1513297 RepID=UPI00234A02C4|nr:sodium:solute symporter family protein [Leptospira sp. GIMC2001]WCL48011.1 Na+:solute symporter [Leptospira sp. GIMC2001]